MAESARSTLAGEPTIPYLPTFDTGEFTTQAELRTPPAVPEPAVESDASPPAGKPKAEPSVVAAQPVEVPASYPSVKRWKFALVVAGVWTVAAAIGLGLYYWWVEDMDHQKTVPVFVLLVYLIGCVVGSLLLAMVQHKPLVPALAVAVMSAPLASTAAAAVLYGAYVFHWIER